MERFISIIIPNHNGAETIGPCLDAAFASQYGKFEVIVTDDGSDDGSIEIIERYACGLVRLARRSGAGAARNRGAEAAKGEILFFTDADCVVRPDALERANRMAAEHPDAVIGGTYSPLPADSDFFSIFQSLFVHYSETRTPHPDYIAGHAMIMDAALFRESGGFPEEQVPIPEDVKFSHRLRRSGRRLVMDPDLQVVHSFRFSLVKSLVNAYRKSKYWTLYSLRNSDLLSDSGTASRELKVNVVCLALCALCIGIALEASDPRWLVPAVALWGFDLLFNRGLFRLFRKEKGLLYAALGALYYCGPFALAVAAGGCAGVVNHMIGKSAARMRRIKKT